jgi:ABC-type multidrug transport system fused ATPase/permease subunit
LDCTTDPSGFCSTVIVVAHKLQSIKTADTICVIEAGKLVESGNHEQLVGRKSRYYELIKSQL